MGFIVFLVLLYGILIGSFAVPFVLIILAPEKRSTFVLTVGFVYYALWEIIRRQEDPNFSAIIDIGDTVLLNILFGVVLSVPIKIFLLFKKGKLKWQKWSYIDFLLIVLVVATISGNFILGRSGVCLGEGRVLDDNEIFPRYVVGRNWYNLSEAERKDDFDKKIEQMLLRYYVVLRKEVNSLGSYRINITTYTRYEPPSGRSREYSERWLTLDACGFYNGSTGSIGESEEKVINNPRLQKAGNSQLYNFK